MQAQKNRTLRSGHEYDQLISRSEHVDKLISKQAGVPQTLKLVQQVVLSTLVQTEKLAPELRGATLEETCRNVWNFIYQHVQYHLDEPGEEQVRQPARSWADRKRGVDCEDYSVFISSILLNLGIPHKLRISAYKGSWQHIYVIVPKDAADVDKPKIRRKDYYTVDCVTDAFDYEVPPTKTQDHPMNLSMLSGLSGVAEDRQITHTYLSESGDLMGIDGLGNLYVHDDDDSLNGIPDEDGLGDLGAFRSIRKAFKKARAQRRFLNPKKVEGTRVQSHIEADAPPAGEPEIVATYVSESGHTIGIDGLGSLYVYDEVSAGIGALADGSVGDLGKLKIFKAVGKAAKAVGKAAGNVAKTAVKVVAAAAPVLSVAASFVPGGSALAPAISKGGQALSKLADSKAGKAVQAVSKLIKDNKPQQSAAPAPAPLVFQPEVPTLLNPAPVAAPAEPATQLVTTEKTVQGKKKTVVKAVPNPKPSKVKKAPKDLDREAKPASKLKRPVSIKPKAEKPVQKHAVKKKVTRGVQPVQQYQAPAPVPASAPVSVDTPAAEVAAPTVVTTSVVRPATAPEAQAYQAPQPVVLPPLPSYAPANIIPMQAGADGAYSAAFTAPVVPSAPAVSDGNSSAALVATTPPPAAEVPFYQKPAVIAGGVGAVLLTALLISRGGQQAPAAPSGRGLSGTSPGTRRKKKPRSSSVQRFKM